MLGIFLVGILGGICIGIVIGIIWMIRPGSDLGKH